MLQLTESVAARLKSTLSKLDLHEGACFRLGLSEKGVTVEIDQERPGDSTVKYEEEVLIVIDSVATDRFEGHTMDYDEDTRQLVFI